MQFIMSGSFCSYLLIPEEKKNFWSELESNPGPLASQATALTTRPWLLGLETYVMQFFYCMVANGFLGLMGYIIPDWREIKHQDYDFSGFKPNPLREPSYHVIAIWAIVVTIS